MSFFLPVRTKEWTCNPIILCLTDTFLQLTDFSTSESKSPTHVIHTSLPLNCRGQAVIAFSSHSDEIFPHVEIVLPYLIKNGMRTLPHLFPWSFGYSVRFCSPDWREASPCTQIKSAVARFWSGVFPSCFQYSSPRWSLRKLLCCAGTEPTGTGNKKGLRGWKYVENITFYVFNMVKNCL